MKLLAPCFSRGVSARSNHNGRGVLCRFASRCSVIICVRSRSPTHCLSIRIGHIDRQNHHNSSIMIASQVSRISLMLISSHALSLRVSLLHQRILNIANHHFYLISMIILISSRVDSIYYLLLTLCTILCLSTGYKEI